MLQPPQRPILGGGGRPAQANGGGGTASTAVPPRGNDYAGCRGEPGSRLIWGGGERPAQLFAIDISVHQQLGPSNVGPGRVSSATEGWCPAWRCGEWVRCRPVASPGGACGATILSFYPLAAPAAPHYVPFFSG
eukprot:gene13405-biopygen14092